MIALKLNHDCIRELMLYLEENLEYSSAIPLNKIQIKDYEFEEIAYTTKKLKEAGYIYATFTIDNPKNMHAYISGITWNGHKFLDTIRDNQVWSHTKKILSKVSSASISFISDIASQVLANLIKQQLGVIDI